MQMNAVYRIMSILMTVVILNLPFVSATEISLLFGSEKSTFSFSADKFVSRQVTISGDRIFLNITAKPAYELGQVLLFPCKSENIRQCAAEEPIEYESYVDTRLKLSDVVEHGEGGIITLVRLNTSSWVGFWDSYENGAFVSRDLGSLELEVNKDPVAVEEFLSEYGMMPIEWVDSIDLNNNSYYQIEAENTLEDFRETLNITRTLDGGAIETQDYLFVFPKAFKIYNALTLYHQLPVECGNYFCEFGETQRTCCRDCGCPENETCSRNGCVPASEITLALDSMNPGLMECHIHEGECFFQDLLELEVHAENPPLDYWINDYFFSFGNEDSKDLACIPNSGIKCSLLLPSMNRTSAFQEKRKLFLYLSIGHLQQGEIMTNEIPLELDLDVRGIDLADELQLQSLQDKLAQYQSMMQTIQALLDFINYFILFYDIMQAINFLSGDAHEALAVKFEALAKSYWACCTPLSTSCCVAAAICEGIAKLEHLQAKSFWARAKIFLEKMLISQAAGMAVQLMLNAIVKIVEIIITAQLKQKMDRIMEDTMTIGGDAEGINLPLLVWANGSISGDYTETVCNGETVEIWYDFTPMNCSDGLWLTPEGMVKQEADTIGTHRLLRTVASTLFPGRTTMTMGVECNSTRYYNVVMDTFPFLNYTPSCNTTGGSQ